MSQRWINVWDDKKTITGSVYLTPTYSSGPENGQQVYTAPATLHFTPSIGAPARHMNYALFQLGDDRIKADQHIGMVFRSGSTWASAVSCAVARSDAGFFVGASSTVVLIRGGDRSPLPIITASVCPVLLDDGQGRLFGFSSGAVAHVAQSSTVTSFSIGVSTPLVAANIALQSMLLGLSGTGTMLSQNFSGTAFSTATLLAGTLNASSTALWDKAQTFVGASTATGPVVFYTKGAATFQYVLTTDCVTPVVHSWTSPPQNTLADVAYDDVQGQFVAAFYSSTGSRLQFMTSSDGLSWTTSSTAQGPANLQVPSGAAAGSVAFKICAGIWFCAITSNQPPNFIYGASGGSGVQTFGYYSLDYGVTWYSAGLLMANASSGTTLRVLAGLNRFLVMHDSDVVVSGRLGYDEPIS